MQAFIGVDLGITNLRCGVVDAKGRLLRFISVKSDFSNSGLAVPLQVKSAIQQLGGKYQINGIGIATPGVIEPKKFEVKMSGIGMHPVDFSSIRKDFRDKNVVFANDCDAAVVAEKVYGYGKGCQNLIYVTFSSGIGAGVIAENKLLLGKHCNATEFGHTTIDVDSELVCNCGSRGHLISFASGNLIPQFAKFLIKHLFANKNVNLANYQMTRQIFRRAKSGDAVAIKIVDEVCRHSAVGIGNLINEFDPEVITIGGSIALENKNLFMKSLLKYVPNYTINKLPKINLTKIGHIIGVVGAAYTSKFDSIRSVEF